MTSKSIGLARFGSVTALHLLRAADAFSAATRLHARRRRNVLPAASVKERHRVVRRGAGFVFDRVLLTIATTIPLRRAFTSRHLASVSFGLVAALATATCSQHNSEPIDVTVRDVVIDPYAVDGKRVRLTGVLHRTADGDALYWHEQDIPQTNRHHGVAIRQSSSWREKAVPPGTRVAVEGLFEADDDRSGSEFNGALLDPRNAQLR